MGKSAKKKGTKKSVKIISILVGGRFTNDRPRGFERLINTSLDWYRPSDEFYWYINNLWGSSHGVFGKATNTKTPDHQRGYFSWQPGAKPSNSKIKKAAASVCEVCQWLRDKRGIRNFQLIGHSAGCRVAISATHKIAEYLGAKFQFENIILLAPPVPKKRTGAIDYTNCTADGTCFPDLRRIKRKLFFNFFVKRDFVIKDIFNVNNHYCHSYVRQDHAEVYRGVRQQEVGLRRKKNHWDPCKKNVWEDEQLEDFINSGTYGGC